MKFTPEQIASTGGRRAATFYALDREVLAVAVERIDGWCAYIGAVPGINHTMEFMMVAQHGSKLPKPLAIVMFPQYIGEPYAH